MTPSGANVTAAPRPRGFSLSMGVQSDWQTRVLAAITATGKHGDRLAFGTRWHVQGGHWCLWARQSTRAHVW